MGVVVSHHPKSLCLLPDMPRLTHALNMSYPLQFQILSFMCTSAASNKHRVFCTNHASYTSQLKSRLFLRNVARRSTEQVIVDSACTYVLISLFHAHDLARSSTKPMGTIVGEHIE